MLFLKMVITADGISFTNTVSVLKNLTDSLVFDESQQLRKQQKNVSN